MIIQPDSKLVMIGDSITDCGRSQPRGEGLFEANGTGYVSIVDGLLTATSPADRIRIVNMGTSGNTVRELAKRWQKDVLDLSPDWVSVFIGINDVWRHFDTPLLKDGQVHHDEYAETLDTLVKQTRPLVKGLILMTPYFIEPNRHDAMRQMMTQYGNTVKALAEKYDAVLVDTQAAFDAVLVDLHPMTLAWDRIHPTRAGHVILARAFLNAIGYEWSPKT